MNSQQLSVPTFFVGPRKTGTSSIHEILAGTDIPMPKGVKETFFFEEPDGVDMIAYAERFAIDPSRPFIEISPSYFASEAALSNILKHFPEAKIVVTLRDPVDRAVSACRHLQRIGYIEKNASFADIERSKHIANILDGSSYRTHVEAWSARFPGRVLVLRQAKDNTYPPDAIAALGAFIGVTLDPEAFRSTRTNRARSARSLMIVGVARKLRDILRLLGLHSVVRLFKPLERLLFTQPQASNAMQEYREFFSEKLAQDVEYFEKDGSHRVV